jgi:hypothetical protein
VATNNASNYWGLEAIELSAANIFTINTSLLSAGWNTQHPTISRPVMTSSDFYVLFSATKNGSPSALYAWTKFKIWMC